MAGKEGDEIEPCYVKICMLTKLNEDEEKKYLEDITKPIEGANDLCWLKPELVYWTSDVDGTIEHDMLPLYKTRTPEKEGYFADRRSVEDGGTILVDRDFYMLCMAEEANEHLTKLADEHGIELPGRDSLEFDWLKESLTDELLERGVVWGRQPGPAWKTSWANLDIGNMDMFELIQVEGEEPQILLDPDWDSGPLVKKLRKELEQ